MTTAEMVAVVTAIAAFINVALITWQAWKKGKPELKKLNAEGESEIAEAAHSSLEASEISTKMLMTRIEELKKDIENEKKARKEDRAYFSRRITELDKELRDYRLWASRLVKQVIDSGNIPAVLEITEDTDRGLKAVNK